ASKPADASREQIGCVRVVTAEELVAALAGERDLHVARRELRDEIRRQRRRIGERLVEGVGEGRQKRGGIRAEHQLAVLRAVTLRNESCVGELVERTLLEADRERAQGLGALLRCKRREERGVDAAREQDGDRN